MCRQHMVAGQPQPRLPAPPALVGTPTCVPECLLQPPPLAACARNELAPLALGAHPEAYSEFKALLLLLVYDRSSGGSGGGASRGVSAQPALRRDWGDEARSALAASVYHTMRQQLGGWQQQHAGRAGRRGGGRHVLLLCGRWRCLSNVEHAQAHHPA